MFKNIENVTIDQGLPGNESGMSPSVNDDIYTVAQLYKAVKKIDRKNGGLSYTQKEKDEYGFAYTETDDGEQYSLRNEEADTTPRGLLANALESAAQTGAEREVLQQYQENLEKMNEQEQKLQELNAQIRELSFAEGKRDKAKISQLRDEATKARNRLNNYDKQLLKLEAAKPIQNILAREKQKAYDRAERKGRLTRSPNNANRN